MSELGPTLPSAQVDRPGRQGLGQDVPPRHLLRLSGLVLAQGRTSLDLEINGQRWTARSAQPLPDAGGRGARVVIDAAPDGGKESERPARLIRTGRGRLQAPVQLVLRRTAGADEAPPAARPDRAPPAVVSVRMVGAGRAWLPARLGLAPQEPAPARLAVEGVTSKSGTRMQPVPSGSPNVRAAAGPAATARQPSAPPPGGGTSSTTVVVDAEVGGSDPAGRLLLRVGERLLQVQEPLHLPKRARVRLTMAATDAARLEQERPDELRPAAPSDGASRPLVPDTRLAARLIDLAGRLGQAASSDRPHKPPAAAEPAPQQTVQIRDQAGNFRLAEGRLGIEPDLVGLRLHLRDDPPEHPGERGGRPDRPEPLPARAIVAVDFDRLGPCQLDILCHGRRFDLRVRSERPLPESIQLEAVTLFLAARDAAGLEGEIAFAPGELVLVEPPARAELGLEA